MNNITVITSIIDTCKNPLSYSNVRSYWTKEERYQDTKKTIESIRKFIPNNKILLIECSLLNEEERNYFLENTDYFLNLYDLNNQEILNKINSASKSMGEGTMTIHALEYLFNNNVVFDNIFKISGRYWLNNKFNYHLFDNAENNIIQTTDISNMFTFLYKLNYNTSKLFLIYLKNSQRDFENCIGYEIIFSKFINNFATNYRFIDLPIGINGYFAVSRNEFLNI
jgi:hypothetical protein